MDFCQKIGTLSGSYDSAQTSSEETGSQLEKKQPSRNNGGSLQLDKEHLLGNLWWDDSVSKVVGKKNYLESLEERGS